MAKIDALKKQARNAEDDEEWSRAIEYYRRALDEVAEDASSSLEVGLYNRIGDLYLKLDDPPHAVYHYLLAVDGYAEDELYPPAIALCRKILRVAPDQVDAYRQLARLHEATGLTADAREALDRYMAGIWESGDVNGALDGLPELMARLMSGEPDLEEVRRLEEEGEAEEAFELLYRQWEDDSAGWEDGDATAEASVPPPSEPEGRGLGDSLRRGWQGLFGDGKEEEGEGPDAGAEAPDGQVTAPDAEVAAPEAEWETEAEAAAGEDAAQGAPDESGLKEADDMAWLREVTASRVPVPEDEEGAGGPGDEPGSPDAWLLAEEEDAQAGEEAETSADEPVEEGPELEIVAHYDEPDRSAAAGESADGAESVEEPSTAPEPAAKAAGEEGAEPEEAEPEPLSEAADEAEAEEAEPEPAVAADTPDRSGVVVSGRVDDGAEPEPPEIEEPAGPPAEVLVAAADRLSRPIGARPVLPGGRAGPRLLSAAEAGTPEGRAAVTERPLDRAVRARFRRSSGTRGAPAAAPEGPAFQTPGREDYLPAGAEVAARDVGAGLLWLSDQVALLGAMHRGEPVAVRPAFGPPAELVRSAARALERSATVQPPPALPSDEAAPALLGSGVAEEPWVAEPVVRESTGEVREPRPPEGPAFETPGREDYLPAGGEIGARLPGDSLTWLADAVEELHWLEWGDPEWIEAARAAASEEDVEEPAADREPESGGRRMVLPNDLLPSPFLPAPPEGAKAGEEEEAGATAAPTEAAPDAAEEAADRPAAEEAPAPQEPEAADRPAVEESAVSSDEDDVPPADATEEVPTPALAWLAASVAGMHRPDASDTDGLEGESPVLADGLDVSQPRVRLDRYDPSRLEDAAEATREALAYLAAREAVARPEPTAEPEQRQETSTAEAPAADTRAADRADRKPADSPAESSDAEVPAGTSAIGGPPRVPEPVPQPAARPNGLDFTALLERIGWLRGSENGHANGHGSGTPTADRPAAQAGGNGATSAWTGDRSSGASDASPAGGSERSGGGKGGPPTIQPPKTAAPGSGVPDFTEMLEKVGWIQRDDRA